MRFKPPFGPTGQSGGTNALPPHAYIIDCLSNSAENRPLVLHRYLRGVRIRLRIEYGCARIFMSNPEFKLSISCCNKMYLLSLLLIHLKSYFPKMNVYDLQITIYSNQNSKSVHVLENINHHFRIS